MLITVSGIDCAGKSTQIERLRAALAAAGEPPIVFWHRPGYSAELDRLRALVRRLRPSALPTTASPKARARAFRSRRVQQAWARLALADMAVQYGARVRAWVRAGKTVICDRYTWDGLLDLDLRFPELAPSRWAQARAVEGLAPTPDVALLLLLPREEMLRRMEAKREPFPDAPEVRDRRFDAYQAMASDPRFAVIDAGGSVDEVHERILGRVRERRAG